MHMNPWCSVSFLIPCLACAPLRTCHPLPTTPNLDAFAKMGVRFEQCHNMHTQCSPSRATMLTGRYMHVLGHGTQTHLLQAYEQNYFQTMKNNGYWIQYYGKNDVFSPDAMNTSVSYWEGDIGVRSGDNAYKYGPGPGPH